MTRNDYPNLTIDQLDAIAIVMDDETREQLHADLAPCAPGVFLTAYLARHPDFPIHQFATKGPAGRDLRAYAYRTQFTNGDEDYVDLIYATSPQDAEDRAEAVVRGISGERPMDHDATVVVLGMVAADLATIADDIATILDGD